MDSLTFTINLKDLNDPGAPEESLNDIKLIIKLLQNTNPNYYLIGNMLNEQLNEQIKQLEKKEDPKEQMKKKLDELCPLNVNSEIASAGFWQYYARLRKSIGEAMGPVCYAAFILARYIEEQNLPVYSKEHNAGTKWVWDFIDYYEEHWQF